jgi:hypothetical protein
MKYSELQALPTDTSSKLNVLDHDRDSLGMDGSQVSVFKQPNEIRFLKCSNGRTLES